jgi:hypothetical protein
VGSLESRIEALEKLYGADQGEVLDDVREERMRSALRLAEEKAAAEEAQGDTRRRRALNELHKWMERR